jgi:hypothetical protein
MSEMTATCEYCGATGYKDVILRRECCKEPVEPGPDLECPNCGTGMTITGQGLEILKSSLKVNHELKRQRDELLKALEGFVKNADLLGDEHYEGVQKRLVDLSWKAIAKAKGES